MKDEAQERYLKHQERKKKLLEENNYQLNVNCTQLDKDKLAYISDIRKSIRIFNNIDVSESELEYIQEIISKVPTSCNRKAVYFVETSPKFAEEMLVGGKNWVDKANKVLLMFASKPAYKSPYEKDFMPYLDGGAYITPIYYACEVLNLGCCFVNPNIREINKDTFKEKYGDDYFCGAFAIGHY